MPRWKGSGAWVKTWSLGANGSVFPGQAALYEPSLRLTNYKFEYLASLDQGSIGSIVRAKDFEHYYAIKLALVRIGQVPHLTLTRYRVLSGRQERVEDSPFHSVISPGVPLRVKVEVDGVNFKTFVNGHMIAEWAEYDLTTGGVGFFAAGRGKARVYWMTVVSQDDFLGRLCAALVPGRASERGQPEVED
jgi:hypothetical protein